MRNHGDIVTDDPLNAHTSWNALRTPTTAPGAFYTRNNFRVPRIQRDAWRLEVGGLVRSSGGFTFADLAALPPVETTVVLECAGNGRTRYAPRPEGTPWGDRAVGCARFKGARLSDVLDDAGVKPGVTEIVFRGSDGPFERSLPLDVAMRDDTLLAYEMEGAPLLAEHGAPVRLLVPRWYAVASVKWLAEARAVAEPFRGHFQAERYVYEPGGAPVREMRVKSLIVEPNATRVGAHTTIRGWAWSGRAPITHVDVSVDGGRTWMPAKCGDQASSTAWRGFELDWVPTKPGHAALLSRAQDAAGATQPAKAEWNVQGYGNNSPVPHAVHVT